MSGLWQNRQLAQNAAEKLKIFAQPQRLMIISALLEHDELSVSAIDEATGIGQPALSQQLAELRKASLVETRREAKQIYYSLADDLTRLCAASIEMIFGNGAPTKHHSEDVKRAGTASVISQQGAAMFPRILP